MRTDIYVHTDEGSGDQFVSLDDYQKLEDQLKKELDVKQELLKATIKSNDEIKYALWSAMGNYIAGKSTPITVVVDEACERLVDARSKAKK